MAYKVLKRVKEQFNIFEDGRKFNPCPQKWVLDALQRVINSGETKERISLNEAEGFFGHTIRELTGKINPSEMEIIQKGDQSVVVNVVPAVRTASLVIDGQGNVTHEQEFLDTEPGKAALSTYESGSGGFSWALTGSDGIGGRVARAFSGFDFVKRPNFIPKHRQQMMLSSIQQMQQDDQMLLSSMGDRGVEADKAQALLAQFNSHLSSDADVIDQLLLSQMMEERSQRELLLSSVIDNSVFFINKAQKEALLRCGSGDKEVLEQLFSSMANTDTSRLPVGGHQSVMVNEQHENVMPEPEFMPVFSPRRMEIN